VPRESGEWDFPWFGRGVARVTAWDPEAVRNLARSGARPFVAVAPRVEPGVFGELEARIPVRGTDVRALRAALEALVASLRCPVLTTRDGDGYAISATAAGRKRRAFLRGTVRATDGGAELSIVVGARFPMRDLVRSLEAGTPVVEVTGISF